MKRGIIVGMMLTLLSLSMLTFAFRVQPVNSEPVTITVVGGWTGAEKDAFLPVLQAFENQTGINVNYTVYTYYELLELLEAQFAAGTTPGDVVFIGPRFIKEKGQEGHILDVTSLIDEANYSTGTFDPVKVCHTLYGGAYTGKVKPGFWYRKSFFAAHNLTEPTTWADFLALLDDVAGISGIENPIASGDGVGWPLSDVTEHFLITFGGPQLHRNLTVGTVAWNSSQVRTIFADRLVPLLQGNFSDPIEWTTALDLWWNGTYGLYFMGSWITGMVDDPDDLGVFSLPGSEGLVFGPDFFFVPVYTEHLDEAKQLFQFLAGAEAQTLQVEQGGHIATNLGVPLEAYPDVDRMVVNLTTEKELLYDLDDAIGGEFQTTFWDQMKLLWVEPGSLDDVLNALEAVAPTTIRVPRDFPTIQEAINAASPGDTIYVCSGTYYENVIVNETVSLIGENRSSTIVDGSEAGNVFSITRDRVNITGFTIKNGGVPNTGIYLDNVNHCNITENDITDNYCGFWLVSSSNNTVTGNNLEESNWEGINLYYSSNNTITGNNIKANNGCGVRLEHSSNNSIYHNNFVNNARPPASTLNSTNVWDDGYPSGGNYWSDYAGSDFYSGPYQDKPNSDGIGDTAYFIDENNQDNYPLMGPWHARVRSTLYSWPMFRHNPRHTGYTESPAPDTNQTQWNYTTGGWVESSPAVADGIVYVGSNDGNIYALDQHTGAHIWNYTAGWSVSSSPAVAYGKVYIGEEDGKVYCLDAATGAHIWNQTTGHYVHSSPAVIDGKVYIGAGYGEGSGRVYCLDAATGAYVWNYTAGDYVRSSPAVANGKVYVGATENNEYVVCCLDAFTGAHIWSYTVGDYVDSSPTIADDKVYVGSWDGKVYCLNDLTGAHIWNHTVGDYVDSSPAVADDKIYIGTGYGIIYCLDAATGAHIWNQTTGDWVASSPTIADDKVYVGSWDGKVYCLDASTGAHVWNYTTGSGVESSPAVADGMVFVGSNDHTVYAFGNIIRVPEDYPTIQSAIDAATGTVISVAPGVYHEHLIINKSITLMGRPGSTPIFEGDASGIAITIINTCEVTITNIAITNYDLGILITESNNCTIYANIMSSMGSSGIALDGTSAADNVICKNIFTDNTIAINLTQSSTSNIIYANTISENDIGIDLSNSNNNIIYHNNFVDNTIHQVYVSMPAESVWDNGYPSGGNYWSDYDGVDTDGDGIGDTPYGIDANNEDRYPLMKPFSGIGITNVITSKTVIGQGFTLHITVKILNYGVYNEISILTVYTDTTSIQTQTLTLASRKLRTVTFLWETTGVAKGNYTISANATILPDETDILDNILTDGWVVVTWLGDLDGDFDVDEDDLWRFCGAFIEYYKTGVIDPNCDFDDDCDLDEDDLWTMCAAFIDYYKH